MLYVSMNWSLRFCILQRTKSYTTPDVLMNWSLGFCILQYTKSYTTPDVPMNVAITILYTAVYKILCDS